MTVTRLRHGIRVFVASAMFCTATLPAMAQSNANQIVAIADMATAVLLAVRGEDMPTQDLRDAAYGAAVSQVMSDAVARYGAAAAETAASVVIVLGAQFHISPAALGRALAQYAAIAPGAVAQATARAVADSAEVQTTQVFRDTARTSGADVLATIADGPARVSGALSNTSGGIDTATGGTNGVQAASTFPNGAAVNGNAATPGFTAGTYGVGAIGGGTWFQPPPVPCPNPSCS